MLIDTNENNENIEPKPNSTRSCKSFLDLGSKQQNNVTDEIRESITSFVDERNEGVQNPITITQLL